ncbi:MAG TPA: ABC-F family ATP-binding cassette domain-containing protein [Vicinamibacterales bacterium]
MIQLSGLSKSFGERVLLDSVTWQIDDRERVGLCGPNGAGKTTLLRMLAGLEEPDSGTIVRPSGLTIGYLPQDGLAHAGRTVFEEACRAFAPLLAMKAEMHALEERMAAGEGTDEEQAAMLDRYSELSDRFRLEEGYTIDLRVTAVLTGLGFSRADFDRPAEQFSGGWQMRLALAKLLLGRPGLLLLDEPTNHLDLEARNWLESYLREYPHAVILVSHDRFFLDAVVTRIADLNLRTITDYHGNYSDYLVERDARIERLRAAKKEQDEEIARVKLFIDRFRYKATKAAQVQSRIKMLEKIVPIEVPPERKRVHFTFPAAPKSGRTVLELKHVRKAYGPLVVFDDVSLHIERGDRIALVGPNGAGKSTLMRMLSGEEAPDRGERRVGHQVVMEYFAQDEAVRLNPDLTVYETLASGSPVHMVPAIRNILGGFLFSGDDVYKRTGVLSGGERTRLAVARMLLRPSNLLLLDEPTNHLDLDSKDVLLDALVDYGGTLIFVSHDRYFVERLATRIIEIGNGKAESFPGTYQEFLWRKEHAADWMGGGQDAGARGQGAGAGQRSGGRGQAPGGRGQGPGAAAARSAAAPRAGQPEPSSARSAKPDYETRKREQAEARRREKERRARQARIAEIEARIAEREETIRTLEAQMAAPGFYDNRDEAQPVIERHQALMWEVGELMQQWEMLSEVAAADGA